MMLCCIWIQSFGFNSTNYYYYYYYDYGDDEYYYYCFFFLASPYTVYESRSVCFGLASVYFASICRSILFVFYKMYCVVFFFPALFLSSPLFVQSHTSTVYRSTHEADVFYCCCLGPEVVSFAFIFSSFTTTQLVLIAQQFFS